MKIKRILTSNAFLLLFPISCILLCYVLFVDDPVIDGYYTIHYLLDYSHGYVVRGGVGAVLSRLFTTLTPEILSNVVRLFDVLMILFSCLCISKALIHVKKEKTDFFVVAFVCLILCISAATYRYFFDDIKLDKLLWALTFLAVLLIDNRIAIVFVPFICLFATLCNPVFLFFGNILVSLLLLQKVKDNHNAKLNIALCTIAYVGMIALAGYGMIMKNRLGFANAEEMLHYYFAKYTDKAYLEHLNQWVDESIFEYFNDTKTILRLCFEVYFIKWGLGRTAGINALFCSLPVGAVITAFWLKVFKTEKDLFQKIIFFFCLIAPVVTIPPILFSWETTKYFSYIFIVQTALFLYYYTHRNLTVRQTVDWFYGRMLTNPVFFSAVGAYLSCVILF